MAIKSLKIAALFAAAWGLLAVTLAGEITTPWIALAWTCWGFSLISARIPQVEAVMRRLETVAVIGFILMIGVDFLIVRTTLFIAVTHFLLVFQSFKLIGPKERKDSLQIFLFAFFQTLAACTLSVDAWNAAILLALIPTSMIVLFWNQIAREYEITSRVAGPTAQRSHRKMAVLICALGLPMTVLLTTGVFVIFPRLALNAPIPGLHRRKMGYADQLNLAEKGNLEENSAVVLWMTFPKSQGRPDWDGHIRGDVLSAFDGRQWSAQHDRTARMLASDPNGIFTVSPKRSTRPALHQRITLSDASVSTLFAIGQPIRVIAPTHTLQKLEGGTLHWDNAWRHPVRYEVISDLSAGDDEEYPPVQIPATGLDRVRGLTDKVAGHGPPLAQAQAIETYLQTHYRYSTDFGDHVPDNPIDYFLFEHPQGSCGHFASAMAVMLRLRGIPSRVVAGYWKGEWNSPAQALVVRERDAHAWVEAYIKGEGWHTFDPTPVPNSLGMLHNIFFTRLREYDDYFSLLWSQFVIQYDLYAQIRAFENLKGVSNRLAAAWALQWPRVHVSFHRPSMPTRTSLIAVGIFFSLAVMSFWILSRRSQTTGDPSIRFYIHFLKRMERLGHPKKPEETGQEYAARLRQERPNDRTEIEDLTNRYYEERFVGPRQSSTIRP